MITAYLILRLILRSKNTSKPAPIRHYFNTPAPAGHVPDESEIPYWL